MTIAHMTDLMHHERHTRHLTPRRGARGLGGGGGDTSVLPTCGPDFLRLGHPILEVGVDFGDFFLGNHGFGG